VSPAQRGASAIAAMPVLFTLEGVTA
jgi:hypothetical protein